MSTPPAITISDLEVRWHRKATWCLRIPQFTLAAGEQLFLAGPSGSGKSTLLAAICGITPVSAGKLEVLGQPMQALPAGRRDRVRADDIGVVFQLFNLLPYLSVLENVMLAGQFAPGRAARASQHSGSARAEAERLLTQLQLPRDLWSRRANELSVGQQQRTAAARALFGSPRLVVADEPTSALDTDTRDRFLELIQSECRRTGAALLFVSHDRPLARHFDRMVELAELTGEGARAATGEALPC
jgi:putative ABC transport system ATP-binding protein